MKTRRFCFGLAAIRSTLLVAAVIISNFASSNALASPVLYQYSTASNPSGASGGAIDYFDPSTFVSGTFMYDPNAPHTSTAGSGAFIFSSYDTGGGVLSSSFTTLTGVVQALNFADPRGRTRVASDEATTEPVDYLTLQSEPTLYTNLSGFTIGGFKLVNVRFFWLEGQLGITDFMTNNSLPGVLPSFQGRLALDFVPIGTFPSTPDFNHTVFFDGLAVAPAVPEPETYAMMFVGLGLIGWQLRRASRRAAVGRLH